MFAKTSRYALRLMTCLALAPEDGPVPGRLLAERAAVPAAYLSKVMRRLEESGLVGARKGRGGGFWLARPADEIALVDVLVAVEEPTVGRSECVFGWGACNAEAPCPLHDAWSALGRDVDGWAERTLADVVAEQTP